MRKPIFGWLFAILWTITVVGGGWAASQEPPQSLGRIERIKGLVRIWAEVKFNFAFFDQVPELDWDKAFEEYLPLVEREQSTKEYYRLLQKFVALLQDGHTYISPPSYLIKQEDSPPLWVQRVEGKAIIVDLVETEEVKKARLSLGMEIIKVNGRLVDEVLERDIYPYVAASTPQSRHCQAYAHLLRGPKGSRVSVEVSELLGNSRLIELTGDSGGRVYPGPPYRHLPLIESRLLSNQIGYIALSSFMKEEVVDEFDKALDNFKEIRGLILDIRQNPGGNSSIGWDIARRLIDKPLKGHQARSRMYIPYFRAQQGERGFWFALDPSVIQPRGDNPFLGPVVVLISPITGSAAEDFLVALESGKRAILVGEKTSGSTGQPLRIELPGGGRAAICTLRCTHADGRPFVGIGIAPHYEVCPTQKDIAEGKDPVLHKGIEIIKEQINILY